MSERYQPAVEANMVTDRADVDFGKVKGTEGERGSRNLLAHEIALAADQKVSKEKSGDFYAEDIEHESNKQTALKIGEIAAKEAGYTDVAAAETAAIMMSMPSSEFMKSHNTDKDEKSIRRSIMSAYDLENDARKANKEEHKAA